MYNRAKRHMSWLVGGLMMFIQVVYADPVGKVLALAGQVTAVQPDGAPRTLANGSPVEAGDTVQTAAGATLQMRFNDGAIVSLRPNSTFRIDAYAFGTQEEKGFFSLLRGGLRTLTGLIGKTRHETYRLNAPVAVVGIRGTDYQLRLCQDDCDPGERNGLYLAVWEGAIVATNAVGEFILGSQQFGFIPDANSAPLVLPALPQPLVQGPQTGVDGVVGKPDAESAAGVGIGTPENANTDNTMMTQEHPAPVLPVLEFRAGDVMQCVN